MSERKEEVTEQSAADAFFGDTHSDNVVHGTAKGIASVVKGTAAGVGSLFTSPIVGAAHGGGMGFMRGAAKGIVSAVVLPVQGIVQGSRQFASGFVNTPEEVRRMLSKDKAEITAEAPEVQVVDVEAEEEEVNYETARKAVLVTVIEGGKEESELVEEEAEFRRQALKQQEMADGSSKASDGCKVEIAGRRIKDTQLYDLLTVPTDATPQEVRKAYFKLAKAVHPENAPGDEAAALKFEELGRAFQILSDPESRERYDRFGMESVDENFMDPGTFFTMTFGAAKFKELVGELTVAFTAGSPVSDIELQQFQASRERKLIESLKARLSTWMDGHEEKFVEEALAQVEELRKQSFGRELLQCIGYTYYHKAEMLLGLQNFLGLPGYAYALREHGHHLKTRYKAIGGSVNIHNLKLAMETEGKTEISDEPLPKFLDSVWMVSILDIESTLKHVVKGVVQDGSISKPDQKKRAMGVMRLGKVFLEA